jgi:hypothetical protein
VKVFIVKILTLQIKTLQEFIMPTLKKVKEEEDEILEIEESQQEEESSVGLGEITKPFNPKDINIIVEPKTIGQLVTRLKFNEIDLNTEFQRMGNLWSDEKQCRLIESILLRLPLPAFYFDADNENKWLVVDGLQRLWCLKKFIVNTEIKDSEKLKIKENRPIELSGLEILTELNDKEITYDKLNRTMQRRILETPITTYLIQPGTPKNVKYNVFKRINSGGVGLNAMEIRNALNQENPLGKKSPAQFLKELSENSRLKQILKLQYKRMEDRELLLRACSFILRDYTDYVKPLSVFLDNTMELFFGKSDKEFEKLSTGIVDSIYFQRDLFGKHLFSRSIVEGSTRLNSALFEVWVSETYNLNKEQKANLLRNKIKLTGEYKKLFSSDDFLRAVVSSTSGKKSVIERFEKIKDLIKKYSK